MSFEAPLNRGPARKRSEDETEIQVGEGGGGTGPEGHPPRHRSWGLLLTELISEGNVGMLQAVKRFDTDRGFRLATYAMWWVRAILRSWMAEVAIPRRLFADALRLVVRLRAPPAPV